MRRSKKDKFFEKIPPSFTWILILFPFFGSLVAPVATAYAIVTFNIYFLYKSVSTVIFFFISYFRIAKARTIDWQKRTEELEDVDLAINQLETNLEFIKQDNKKVSIPYRLVPDFLARIINNREKRKVIIELEDELRLLRNIDQNTKRIKPSELNHIVMIPHWKEPYKVLKDTLTELSKQTFPSNQISIVLGAEARDPDGVSKSERLRAEFKDKFANIWISNHELQENEIIGKSSNMAWAGKIAKLEVDKLGWDLKKTTITSCDADSLLPKEYFSYLSYEYLTNFEAEYKFYVSAIIFYANIWRLPFYARVKNSIGSLYNISKISRTDKLQPFSTYSTSFWLIDQIGYWTPWVTPEDYHIFFKSLFKFPERVGPIALYQTILSDAAEGSGHVETIKNNYFQERRWSWGISDDGWMLEQLFKLLKEGRLKLRVVYRTLHVIFDHIIGVATTVIIVLGGNLPTLLNAQFANTVFGSNLARTTSYIIQTTLVFLVILIIFDNIYLKPPKPGDQRDTILNRLLNVLEWLILPYISFLVIFLPGIEAHTRLLFGKYLEYYLTKKKE